MSSRVIDNFEPPQLVLVLNLTLVWTGQGVKKSKFNFNKFRCFGKVAMNFIDFIELSLGLPFIYQYTKEAIVLVYSITSASSKSKCSL